MVTPSVVVRVNKWVALPRVVPALTPVTSGTAGIIGQATVPEAADAEAAAPAPGPPEEKGTGDIGVALATRTPPGCLIADDESAPVAVSPIPVAAAATATAAATTNGERRRIRRSRAAPLTQVTRSSGSPVADRRSSSGICIATTSGAGPRLLDALMVGRWQRSEKFPSPTGFVWRSAPRAGARSGSYRWPSGGSGGCGRGRRGW